MYRLDPSVGAVVHTHSVHSTVLGLESDRRGALELKGYELLKAFPGISTHDTIVSVPIFDNTQDMVSLAGSVTERWKNGARRWRKPCASSKRSSFSLRASW
jgi:methylthioribulose-1-phosphate dehydratase